MKKLLLPISIFIDTISILLITMYLLNIKNDTTNRVFLFIYMLFLVVHIIDKVRKTKIIKGLEKYKLNKNSDMYYYISLILVLLFDIFIVYKMFSGTIMPDYITVLIMIYLVSILTYDVNHIYYNKDILIYASKKIDLKGIEKIVITKKFLTLFLTVYYKKHDSITIKGTQHTLLEIKEFLEKRKKK